MRGKPARGEAPRSKSASEASREGNGEEGRELLVVVVVVVGKSYPTNGIHVG